ncbi:MAG: DUF424 domain-containing protein [Thermoprotei archaeon]|nr:MAG: DUF424 domain-containing protein [Thermoprotei archaeon]HDD33959.1 DUF424 family protein [Thermofilaceae archaeon]
MGGEKWCYIKVHRRGKDVLVAVCDEELLGSEIRAGSLRIRIREEFYGGRRIPLSQLREYLRGATIVNAIGNDVVRELAKWVDVVMDAAVELGGVLHVQLLLR